MRNILQNAIGLIHTKMPEMPVEDIAQAISLDIVNTYNFLMRFKHGSKLQKSYFDGGDEFDLGIDVNHLTPEKSKKKKPE